MTLGIALIVAETDVYLYEAERLDGEILLTEVPTGIDAATAVVWCRRQYHQTAKRNKQRRQRYAERRQEGFRRERRRRRRFSAKRRESQ